jgi:beta-N-acetylhexosaminidase
MTKAFITGCAGEELSREERGFLAAERPWGLILFGRNCKSAGQIRALVASFREAVGVADAPVLIDQEGGRVRRLRPPLVEDYPAGSVYGKLFAANREAGLRAAHLGGRLIGADLAGLGIDVDCAPILDVPTASTSDAIGDRAYATDAGAVAEIGRALAGGLLEAGVLPVVKHMPGHGRATVDSHHELPVVTAEAEELEAVDFEPFRRLRDLPMAMTAHVVFTALDPDNCATQSRRVIGKIIRERIGFDGLLMSDDLSMKALGGEVFERVEKLFAAGCDIALHCNGDMAEMVEVARASPELAGDAARRADAALAARKPARPFDRKAARAEFDALLAEARALS